MSLQDGKTRFQQAVGILVDEKDRIKDRLLIAYASQLSLIDAKRVFPPNVVEQFGEIRNVLSDAGMAYGYGEHAAAKLRALDEEQASQLARQVFEIFLDLCCVAQSPTAGARERGAGRRRQSFGVEKEGARYVN